MKGGKTIPFSMCPIAASSTNTLATSTVKGSSLAGDKFLVSGKNAPDRVVELSSVDDVDSLARNPEGEQSGSSPLFVSIIAGKDSSVNSGTFKKSEYVTSGEVTHDAGTFCRKNSVLMSSSSTLPSSGLIDLDGTTEPSSSFRQTQRIWEVSTTNEVQPSPEKEKSVSSPDASAIAGVLERLTIHSPYSDVTSETNGEIGNLQQDTSKEAILLTRSRYPDEDDSLKEEELVISRGDLYSAGKSLRGTLTSPSSVVGEQFFTPLASDTEADDVCRETAQERTMVTLQGEIFFFFLSYFNFTKESKICGTRYVAYFADIRWTLLVVA